MNPDQESALWRGFSFVMPATTKPMSGRSIARLRAIEGFEPWLDKEDLLPGQGWAREIPRALQTSDFILIFLSRTSVAKRGYVQREMKMALDVWEELPEGTIHTIPVRLDDCGCTMVLLGHLCAGELGGGNREDYLIFHSQGSNPRLEAGRFYHPTFNGWSHDSLISLNNFSESILLTQKIMLKYQWVAATP